MPARFQKIAHIKAILSGIKANQSGIKSVLFRII
jgi:hypothetical protein